MNPTVTSSLLEQAKANAPEAWERIIRLFSPLVHYWCRCYGMQESDAADTAQDVFRSVFEKLGGFRKDKPGDSFRKWLKTITSNKVIDFYRKKSHDQVPGGSDFINYMNNVPVSPESASESDFDQEDSEKKHVIRRAMELLRIETETIKWNAFWMTTVEELPAGDVAQKLGLTTNQVYLAKSRLLARFRELFVDLLDDFPPFK